MIKTRYHRLWDDPRGSMILGGALVAMLGVNFSIKIYEIS